MATNFDDYLEGPAGGVTPAADLEAGYYGSHVRHDCLKMALDFDKDSPAEDIIIVAKLFSDFILFGKLSEPKEETDEEAVRRRGFGTLAYDEDGNEV